MGNTTTGRKTHRSIKNCPNAKQYGNVQFPILTLLSEPYSNFEFKFNLPSITDLTNLTNPVLVTPKSGGDLVISNHESDTDSNCESISGIF